MFLNHDSAPQVCAKEDREIVTDFGPTNLSIEHILYRAYLERSEATSWTVRKRSGLQGSFRNKGNVSLVKSYLSNSFSLF